MSTTTLLSNGWSPLLTVTLQLLFFQLKNDFVRSSTRLTSASLALCQEIKLSLFSGIPWAFFDPCQIELPLFPYHSQQHCLLVHGFEIFVKIFIHICSIEYFFQRFILSEISPIIEYLLLNTFPNFKKWNWALYYCVIQDMRQQYINHQKERPWIVF